MTFSDSLSLTFLVAAALSALMIVAVPLAPGLLAALKTDLVVSTSLGAALAVSLFMLAALLALQRRRGHPASPSRAP
jgi:hypothetical protein